jgi:hypothetical protein
LRAMTAVSHGMDMSSMAGETCWAAESASAYPSDRNSIATISVCVAIWFGLPSWPQRSGLPRLSSLRPYELQRSGQWYCGARRRVAFGVRGLHGMLCYAVRASALAIPHGRHAVVGAASACLGQPHKHIRRSSWSSSWLCLSPAGVEQRPRAWPSTTRWQLPV